MEYPNLELVAYRAQLMLQNDEEFKEKLLITYKNKIKINTKIVNKIGK